MYPDWDDHPDWDDPQEINRKKLDSTGWDGHLSPHSCLYGDRKFADFLYCQGRLIHSVSITSPEKPCLCFDSSDQVRCAYLFGETILETIHTYGQCPWKTLKERLKKQNWRK